MPDLRVTAENDIWVAYRHFRDQCGMPRWWSLKRAVWCWL